MSKFGREFAVPKTNDYNIMKNFLKDEFMKGMKEYYPDNSQYASGKSSGSFMDRISIKEPDVGLEKANESFIESGGSFNFQEMDSNSIFLAVGAVIFVLSIIEILTINSGIGIFALFIGVVILCYGFYKTRDVQEHEERTRIIREHLLTLSDEYYVFYNVKTPTSSSSINHLVVGPTGIYALLSQKYNPKLRLESENENLSLIGSSELDEEKLKK